jgi:DNA-binding beta-propeller fold protein YncE
MDREVGQAYIQRLDNGAGSSMMARILGGCCYFLVSVCVLAAPSVAQESSPHKTYFVYVVCEGADKIAVVKYGPNGAAVDHTLRTGRMPGADISGPHGIVVSPDRQFYYVTLAHGRPFGQALKYRTKDDAVVGQVTLGYFPATVDITPDGNFIYEVNFNLHGDMIPSSVSVVATDEMVEAARISTCVMPHGSRLNPDGSKQYSACMMDDMLVEIDTGKFAVSRHFLLSKGKEAGAQGPPPKDQHAMENASCSPTWAQPSPDGKSVYVACNKSDEIVEVGVDRWSLKRRVPAGTGVYNLAISKDGKLVASNKRAQSVSVFDLSSGRELARLPTKRKIPDGVVISPDGLFAFVAVEGIGSEPGTVEVIDLHSLKTVATVDVPEQAVGIDFWKAEEASTGSGN